LYTPLFFSCSLDAENIALEAAGDSKLEVTLINIRPFSYWN